MRDVDLAAFAHHAVQALHEEDGELYELLRREHRRQNEVLWLVASSYMSDPSILATGAMALGNVTTDGYPGSRYLPGCELADRIETLAIERAKLLFHAQHANVQPHSCTSANQAIIFRFLQPGDAYLGMDLKAGGHLTHGSRASVLARCFRPATYGVDEDGWIDYEAVRRLAREIKPRLIIAGASAYSRRVDYGAFRSIADEVNAYVLADISHIAGLIAAEELPSPIDQAHFTTASTYKQLGGPKGGLILLGRDGLRPGPDPADTLIASVDRAVVPFFQDTPNLAAIAGKARAFAVVASKRFREIAKAIRSAAQVMATELMTRGYRVLTNGSDNHLVLVDLRSKGIPGVIAERALEACHIVANRNPVPGDPLPPHIASGLRFGTNIMALRGFDGGAVACSVEVIDRVLSSVRVLSETRYELPDEVERGARREIERLCQAWPVPGY